MLDHKGVEGLNISLCHLKNKLILYDWSRVRHEGLQVGYTLHIIIDDVHNSTVHSNRLSAKCLKFYLVKEVWRRIVMQNGCSCRWCPNSWRPRRTIYYLQIVSAIIQSNVLNYTIQHRPTRKNSCLMQASINWLINWWLTSQTFKEVAPSSSESRISMQHAMFLAYNTKIHMAIMQPSFYSTASYVAVFL